MKHYTNILLILSLIVLSGCSATLTNAEQTELQIFLAQEIINEHLSSDGSIVAHLPYNLFAKSSTSLPKPLKVWRNEHQQLIEENTDAFTKAVANNRANWPRYTYYFFITSSDVNKASVDVYTLYNQGLAPTSRGGYAQTWNLEKQSGKWIVISKKIFESWD